MNHEFHEAVLKASDVKHSFELNVAMGKIWNNFPQVQLMKLSHILQVSK